jgi:hypothetical protein
LAWCQNYLEQNQSSRCQTTSLTLQRCLLIEDGNQLILIDTGMGNKQSEKFMGTIRFGEPKIIH